MNRKTRACIISMMFMCFPRFLTAEIPSQLSMQIMHFDSLLTKDPDNIDAMIRLGGIYRRMGVDDEAERFFLEAFALSPGNAAVNLELGEIALGKGEYEQAKTMLGKCVAVDPACTRALNMLAEIAMMVDDDKPTAKNYYERVLAVDRTNEKALLNLGVLLTVLGDTTGAIIFVKKYVAAYPDSVRGHMNLGILYSRTNRFHDAVVQFTGALSLDDKNLEALQGLGGLYFKKKVYMESNAIFERARKISSTLPISIGLALGYHFENQPEKALSTLDNAIAGAIGDAYMLRLLMADIALLAGRHDAAIGYCRMAHELKDDEQVDQDIVNAVYRVNTTNPKVVLHEKKPNDQAPLYQPGSIVQLFNRKLSD